MAASADLTARADRLSGDKSRAAGALLSVLGHLDVARIVGRNDPDLMEARLAAIAAQLEAVVADLRGDRAPELARAA